VFGPLLGALVFLGVEEIIKAYTEHWAVIFGPLIVLIALSGNTGIVGLLYRLDAKFGALRGALPRRVSRLALEGKTE
jgi:branched-chain amino acid transport system permease protein